MWKASTIAALLLCALAWALPAPAHANCAAPCTKTQVNTDITTNWPDNTTGLITPAQLRSTVQDLLNSYLDVNGSSSFTCTTHQFLTAIATLSSYSCAQPAFTDISGTISAAQLAVSTANNILGSDTTLNNTSNYFDGPSMAQGTSGTWFVSGYATVEDTGSAAQIFCKMWDGTTVIASGDANVVGGGFAVIALSGILATPAANIKISCRDSSNTTGLIKFNATGNSKDSAVTGLRIG